MKVLVRCQAEKGLSKWLFASLGLTPERPAVAGGHCALSLDSGAHSAIGGDNLCRSSTPDLGEAVALELIGRVKA